MLYSDEQLYDIITNKSYINIFNKYIKNITNAKELYKFLNTIDNNIINDFKIITNDLHIGFMCYKIHQNYGSITRYHCNGLFLIEDYVWEENEIIKEFIILLFCTYYENKFFNN